MLRQEQAHLGHLGREAPWREVHPCEGLVYRTPDGVDIDGWYYLPPNFDPSKKYPMIVYYYGGTIPLSRELETTYDLAMFAAQGYVAYSLNPRGTVGTDRASRLTT